MKTFILLMIISTSENYNRGFGDGIAASKSASAAIQTTRFKTKVACEKVKNTFLQMEYAAANKIKAVSTVVGGPQAECIEIEE